MDASYPVNPEDELPTAPVASGDQRPPTPGTVDNGTEVR